MKTAFVPCLAAVAAACASLNAQTRVYLGTYASETSKGIYVSTWDAATGALGEPALAAETKSPSFLALSPDKKYLVAVNESGTEGQPGGAVSSYQIDAATGALTLLSEQPSGGAGPCHVAISPDGKVVVAANYGGGSFASYGLGPDGALTPAVTFVQNEGKSVVASRQAGPHAHSATFSPDGKYVYVCDLGVDKIFGSKVLPNLGSLEPLDPPAAVIKGGSGPRHFAFHPTLPIAYVINELNSTLTTLTYDAAKGELKPAHTISTLPADFKDGNSTAHVTVHPSGKWVYGSNRGHNSIARFTVDASTGWLRFAEATPSGGAIPRNFSLDPSGKWLLAANQGSNNVVVFKVDPTAGTLEATEKHIALGKPVCVVFY